MILPALTALTTVAAVACLLLSVFFLWMLVYLTDGILKPSYVNWMTVALIATAILIILLYIFFGVPYDFVPVH